MTLSEKSAYLKGLMDGMKLDTEKDENKLIASIIELLGDVTVAVDDLEDNAIAVSDELDEIEDNLDAIDEFLMDEDDDDDDFFDEDEDYDLGDDYDYEDDAMYEVTCPKCGEVQQVDEDTLLQGSIICPKCGEPLEFEFDEDDGEGEPVEF